MPPGVYERTAKHYVQGIANLPPKGYRPSAETREKMRISMLGHQNYYVHGHDRRSGPTRTYKTWGTMRQRCLNPTDSHYARYGGRGITICERWDSYVSFLEDMGERSTDQRIHRMDNDGPYCRENCMWIDKREHSQLHGRRTRRSNDALQG